MGNFSSKKLSISLERLLSSFSSEEIFQLILNKKISWEQIRGHIPPLIGTKQDIPYLKFYMLFVFASGNDIKNISGNFESKYKKLKNILSKNNQELFDDFKKRKLENTDMRNEVENEIAEINQRGKIDAEYAYLNCLFDGIVNSKLLLDSLVLSGFYKDAEFLLRSTNESFSEQEVNFYNVFIRYKLKKYNEVLTIIKSKNLVDTPSVGLSKFYLNLFKRCNEKI